MGIKTEWYNNQEWKNSVNESLRNISDGRYTIGGYSDAALEQAYDEYPRISDSDEVAKMLMSEFNFDSRLERKRAGAPPYRHKATDEFYDKLAELGVPPELADMLPDREMETADDASDLAYDYGLIPSSVGLQEEDVEALGMLRDARGEIRDMISDVESERSPEGFRGEYFTPLLEIFQEASSVSDYIVFQHYQDMEPLLMDANNISAAIDPSHETNNAFSDLSFSANKQEYIEVLEEMLEGIQIVLNEYARFVPGKSAFTKSVDGDVDRYGTSFDDWMKAVEELLGGVSIDGLWRDWYDYGHTASDAAVIALMDYENYSEREAEQIVGVRSSLSLDEDRVKSAIRRKVMRRIAGKTANHSTSYRSLKYSPQNLPDIDELMDEIKSAYYHYSKGDAKSKEKALSSMMSMLQDLQIMAGRAYENVMDSLYTMGVANTYAALNDYIFAVKTVIMFFDYTLFEDIYGASSFFDEIMSRSGVNASQAVSNLEEKVEYAEELSTEFRNIADKVSNRLKTPRYV